MIERRGFLSALLAAAAAPAFVKASSLMPILVPNKELILPSVSMTLDDAIPNSEYTFSMYMKSNSTNNQWIRIVRTMRADANGQVKAVIPMKDKEQQVWGLQMEASDKTEVWPGKWPMTKMSTSEGSSLLLKDELPGSVINTWAGDRDPLSWAEMTKIARI